jgi:DNA-binding Lrp family transcriptional regulator
MRDKERYPPLSGTTLKIYRIIYAEGKPLGLNDIRDKAGLSSPSVAHYHVSKLLNQGLISEREGGYVAERAVFENMIRIRRSLVLLHMAFAIFFGTTLVGFVFLVRPSALSSLYVLALVVNVVAFGVFLYETYATLRKWKL